MADEYGNNIISLTDDDGHEVELEHLDTFEYKKNVYLVMLPADMSEDDPDYGLVILRTEKDEDGEEFLCDIESDEERNEVYEYYMNEEIWDEE
jgi:uncharacterized protein YrzB (UPF0473 family)